MDQQLFQPGDLVKHPLRPEWGDGKVREVALAKHNGKEGQRLVILDEQIGSFGSSRGWVIKAAGEMASEGVLGRDLWPGLVVALHAIVGAEANIARPEGLLM